MKLGESAIVGIVGAGAMGAGIAQVAACHGHLVFIHDANHESILRAGVAIDKGVKRLVEKSLVTQAEGKKILERLHFGDNLEIVRDCHIVIEAVSESLKLKQELFFKLEALLSESAVLATNTSSLSIASIAAACRQPERVIGVHFFNPAPVMPLVEIVPGLLTAPDLVSQVKDLAQRWGKHAVLAKDTPGFIVNRVARPFYGEALRIYEEGIADPMTIDWAMRELGGFRMGPFELMDFIGHDVNYKVTETVFESFFFDPRYKPSLSQKRLVEARLLGRKSGRGFYDYRDGAAQLEPKRDKKLGQKILNRILCLLINEAAEAVQFQVASVSDIDTAMQKGVNYPRGLLAWADELGLNAILENLEALQAEYGEDRYRPSALLRRYAKEGRQFHKS